MTTVLTTPCTGALLSCFHSSICGGVSLRMRSRETATRDFCCLHSCLVLKGFCTYIHTSNIPSSHPSSHRFDVSRHGYREGMEFLTLCNVC